MDKLNFYHLTTSKLGRSLPILLDKIRLSGKKILILCENNEIKKLLDQQIWTFSPEYFIPHGTDEDPQIDCQPIFLTCNISNQIGAEVLFIAATNFNAFAEIYNKILQESNFITKIEIVAYMFEETEMQYLDVKNKMQQLPNFNNIKATYFMEIGTSWREI
jgi:DNA polymerase IIIc chi subunit